MTTVPFLFGARCITGEKKERKWEREMQGREGSIVLCSLQAARLKMFPSHPSDEKWQAESNQHHRTILTHVTWLLTNLTPVGLSKALDLEEQYLYSAEKTICVKNISTNSGPKGQIPEPCHVWSMQWMHLVLLISVLSSVSCSVSQTQKQQFGRDLRTDSVLNRQMSASIWSLAVGKQKPSK